MRARLLIKMPNLLKKTKIKLTKLSHNKSLLTIVKVHLKLLTEFFLLRLETIKPLPLQIRFKPVRISQVKWQLKSK